MILLKNKLKSSDFYFLFREEINSGLSFNFNSLKIKNIFEKIHITWSIRRVEIFLTELAACELLDKFEKNRETMEETKKIKMLSFKNTQFISEGHMMSKIPDEYKKDGNKFIMRDSANNQYLVEWSSEPTVTKKINMELVNEQKERIKQLWGYKSAESKTSTSSFRMQENNEFADMVNKARKLMD